MNKLNKLLLFCIVTNIILLISACSNTAHILYFDSNGGSEIASIINNDTTIIMPEDPTKEGYKFKGWFLDDDTFLKPFTESNILNKLSSNDVTVYAKWEIINYNINYNYIDGSAENITSFNVESEDIILNNPIKNGYTFQGWLVQVLIYLYLMLLIQKEV